MSLFGKNSNSYKNNPETMEGIISGFNGNTTDTDNIKKNGEIVTRLLEFLKKNKPTQEELQTTLSTSVESGMTKIIDILIEHGANTGMFLDKFIAENGRESITKIVKTNSTRLVKDCVETCVVKGLGDYINDDTHVYTETFNTTPLIVATNRGNIEVAKILIDNGANVELEDNLNNTPLMWAKGMNMIKFLMEHGADTTRTNSIGANLSYFAIDDFTGDNLDETIDIIEIALNAGFQLNIDYNTSTGYNFFEHVKNEYPSADKVVLSERFQDMMCRLNPEAIVELEKHFESIPEVVAKYKDTLDIYRYSNDLAI